MAAETLVIINILVLLLCATITGILSGLCSYFLDYCLWPGQIFGRYLPWLARRIIKLHNRAERMHLHTQLCNVPREVRDEKYMEAASRYALYKILGGCIYCSAVWQSIMTFTMIAILLGMPWWALPVHIVASHALLRRWLKD
jgi:hypothetical protein